MRYGGQRTNNTTRPGNRGLLGTSEQVAPSSYRPSRRRIVRGELRQVGRGLVER